MSGYTEIVGVFLLAAGLFSCSGVRHERDGGADADGGLIDDGDIAIDVECTGEVWDDGFNTQHDGNLERLSGYAEVTGSIRLYDTDLRNLAALACLIEVDSIDMRGNDHLTSLRGLEALTSVPNQLSISDNIILVDLRPLQSLSFVGGLGIGNNWTLIDLRGLESIEATGSLGIVENMALESLEGLDSVVAVDGRVAIHGNPELRSVNLPRLESVEQFIEIEDNASLESLNLDSLSAVGGHIRVLHNPRLPACEVDQLAERLQLAGWTGGLGNFGNDDTATCP